jgi:outer membrane protein OmpA-like peptidoglycan-associated protein
MKKILIIQKIAQCSLLLLVLAAGNKANGQLDQRLALAEKYYAAGEYYTAADLYEQYLNPPKKEIPKSGFPLNTRRYGSSGESFNRTDIVFRQAESYRLANYWQQAAEKYKECFEKDKSAYADALYWYAVCQRSLGNYATAEDFLTQYINNGKTAVNKTGSEKEFAILRFIKNEMAKPDAVLYRIAKNKTSFSKEKGIFALTAINGNQFVFTSTVTETAGDGSNPNHSRLFYAALTDGVLENAEQATFNEFDASLNQGAATISPDKKTLYLTQWRKVNGKNVSSIYQSHWINMAWSKPVLLDAVNTEGFSSKQPFCSADGKKLFFASDRPGGAGGFDIWYVSINNDGGFGEPINAAIINSDADEQAPFFHVTSNTLVFATNGRLGMGGYDLFSSKWNESVFTQPENMGYPVNSSRDDIYFFAPEKKELLKEAVIGSDRGSECCLETYSLTKLSRKMMVTGTVIDCATKEPLADAVVIMKGKTVKSQQIKTGADGKFSFETEGELTDQQFNIIKSEYKDKAEKANAETINNSDPLLSIYNNVPLCLEKIEKPKPVEKKIEIKAENVVTLYYDFDKSVLRDRERKILDSVYTMLAENKTWTIQISGYTDGFGTNEYNDKLSDRRAKAAADYLAKKGIETSRISFVSFGECCPAEMELIDGRDNPDGRSKNRRALINITRE